MPFAASWMDLEIIILSEESQRKTNIVLLICGIFKKKDTNELIQKNRNTHRHRKQTYGYQREKFERDKSEVRD